MDSSPATRERENGAQGNEVQEDDYMGDLSQFLPSDAFDPPKISSSKKISSKKDPLVNPSRNRLKTLSWQERRKLERERKQQEEDEQTLAKVEAPIPQSNIGFKLLKQMGYTPGSALGKQGSGRAEPVGIEIRRSRAGVGLEDPHKEKRKKEEIMMNRKRRKEEDLMKEFGSRQKSQWQSKRVIINYNKAKAALDQLENREIVEPQKNDDDSEVEEEEEEITEEELNDVLMKLRDEFNYCLFCGCKYESSEALLDNCPGTNEDDH
ncbi:G patch domain-containing protein 11 isoform X1 [Vigna radiata var. radiata]|uniref:G patch domain-containing protein 11 isoform X1 n=1 Tax=Vigna radiata var. radiata TaxID=3916 RepID=A0A1S3V220_VIGRR|nr:G patch domain-containing protein 11 isoform X1 [Vigna radiata var. radiata]